MLRVYNKYTVEVRYPFIMQPSSTIYGLVFAEGGNGFATWEGLRSLLDQTFRRRRHPSLSSDRGHARFRLGVWFRQPGRLVQTSRRRAALHDGARVLNPINRTIMKKFLLSCAVLLLAVGGAYAQSYIFVNSEKVFKSQNDYQYRDPAT